MVMKGRDNELAVRHVVAVNAFDTFACLKERITRGFTK